MKLPALLLASLFVVPLIGAENNEPIVETAPYLVGALGDSMIMCDTGADYGVSVGNYGGSCHSVPTNAGTVNIAVHDVTSDIAQMGFFVRWTTGPEESVDQQFCGADNGVGLPIPEGATELRVFVNGPVTSLACGEVAAGTIGEVVVQWNIRSGKDGR